MALDSLASASRRREGARSLASARRHAVALRRVFELCGARCCELSQLATTATLVALAADRLRLLCAPYVARVYLSFSLYTAYPLSLSLQIFSSSSSSLFITWCSSRPRDDLAFSLLLLYHPFQSLLAHVFSPAFHPVTHRNRFTADAAFRRARHGAHHVSLLSFLASHLLPLSLSLSLSLPLSPLPFFLYLYLPLLLLSFFSSLPLASSLLFLFFSLCLRRRLPSLVFLALLPLDLLVELLVPSLCLVVRRLVVARLFFCLSHQLAVVSARLLLFCLLLLNPLPFLSHIPA